MKIPQQSKRNYRAIWLKSIRKIKRIFVPLCMLALCAPSLGLAQTVLSAGDVAPVAVNAANPDKFSVVLLKNIAANTVINFTDNGFTGTNTTGRTGEGFLTFTAPSNLNAGTVLSWANGMTVTGTGWSSGAPTNFSFNASGDQLFIFQGSTTNWATQSGITLLFGMNYGIALNATSTASNTVQPATSILPITCFLNLPSSTYANSYFANGSTASNAVSVSDAPTNLLALFADATRWYGNSAAAATFPSFNIVVTGSPTVTGSLLTPSSLSSIYGTASSEATFNVFGIDLLAGILITPPSSFLEISLTSGGPYADILTVGNAGLTPTTPVYIHLKNDAPPATYSGNIVLSSSGASPVNIALAASVVSPKVLTISSATASNKVYDASNAATITGSVLSGIIGGEVVTINGSGIFATSFASTGISVTSTQTLSGADASHYSFTLPLGLSANIIAKPLTISGLSANNKVYDGNTNASLTGTPSLIGVETSDISNVILGGTAIASFTSPAVANNVPILVTGYSISGSAASNYALSQPSGLTANIYAPTTLNQTITFNPLSNATYGDAPVTLTATASSGLPVSYTSSNTNVVTISGNTFIIIAPGTTTITALQGGNSGYYAAPNQTQNLLINTKTLTVNGAIASAKMYDGTTDATITGSSLVGVVGSDIVTINNTGTFANGNAGVSIPVTSTQVLSGANASNYTVTLPTNLSANILPATQTIIFGALSNKIVGDPAFNLTATGGASGNTITYLSSNTNVATVSGNTVTIIGAGSTVITASQAGNSNYNAAIDVPQTLIVSPVPSLTDIIMPQYIQGVNGTNTNRIPFTSFLTLNNLLPNATYRYFTAIVIASDAATSNGAGNSIFVSPSGFTKTSSPSLSTTGNYGTFTTNSSGAYSGWFALEPTGNATRFIPGNNVFIRLNINDGANGTTVVTRLTTTNSAKVINLVASAGVNNGSGLRGLSSATDKNFVVLYDNIAGTGRPISASFVENDGSANVSSYATFYSSFVEAISGAYGVVIPNTNANGIQRIEQRAITNAALVGCPATDADGIWPSGANTVNPTSGTSAVVITSTDANLANSCSSILNLICYIEGYWDGTSAMLPVLANQGEPTTATATDSITVELRNENSPYGLIASVRTILNQNGTALCTFPSLSGSYYVVIKHRNSVQTWSALPISIGAIPANYNFSADPAKAYGANEIEIASNIFAIYSGDVEVDENLDLLDLGLVEADISNFSFGYLNTDINGDGNVDLLDSGTVETNISAFVFSNHP